MRLLLKKRARYLEAPSWKQPMLLNIFSMRISSTTPTLRKARRSSGRLAWSMTTSSSVFFWMPKMSRSLPWKTRGLSAEMEEARHVRVGVLPLVEAGLMRSMVVCRYSSSPESVFVVVRRM